MKYADYEFYVNEYQGELSEEEFMKVILPASAHVQRATFGRADLHKEESPVKLATCSACDALAECQRLYGSGVIASENNDGYSVSYCVDSSKSTDDVVNGRVYSAIELYLSSTDLLDF